VNAERFITPELKEWEERILGAEEKALKLEAALFASLVEALKRFTDRVLATADSIATLDCILSFAGASEEQGYSRPEIDEGYSLEIEGGRHPVVEAGTSDFVSNDLALDPDERIIILTGPNMAGKSTYLRQNALIVLMAQAGSFVPAARASIGVVDRIFTRVGASDDLSRGHSTFMVEMSETANILNNASPRSFIVLDEIGRGTSTFDGLSIAWAVVEHIHDSPSLGAKTLFATHYHELTELSLTKERVKNYNMAVKEWNERIIFLRKVLPGGANRSYGIQVARLAGVPDEVISRAREILRNLETGELTESGVPRLAARDERPDGTGQMSLLGSRDALREELRRVDVDTMTPIEAITALHKLKEMLD
jgi:DNA mismatch repair protein MutS